MVSSEKIARDQICKIGALLYQKNLVAACDGNLSVRLDDGRIIATPSGVCKGMLTPDLLVVLDASGSVIDAPMKPSSELPMHLKIYRDRPDVFGVVHAHPPASTAYACAGIALDRYMTIESVISLGKVPLAKYATPSTDEVPESIAELIKCHDAILLEFHGALTLGSDLEQAFFKMETLEQCAKIGVIAKTLGSERYIPQNDIDRLLSIHKKDDFPCI